VCFKAAQRLAQPERKEEGEGNEKVTLSRSQQYLKLSFEMEEMT
jgi:hypothetical protein